MGLVGSDRRSHCGFLSGRVLVGSDRRSHLNSLARSWGGFLSGRRVLVGSDRRSHLNSLDLALETEAFLSLEAAFRV